MSLDSEVVKATENVNEDSDLPPFNQRFERLKPSRELLEFYRHKIAEYDTEYQQLFKKLEGYARVEKDLEKSRWENRQHEDEIKQLQQALSDMQVYLFQEREHVLRLYAENDRLKIQELGTRKKIQQLLTLPQTHQGGGEGSREATYMFKEPGLEHVLIQQHHPRPEPNDQAALSVKSGGRGPGGHKKSSSSRVKTSANKENRSDNINDDSTSDTIPDTETMLLTVEAVSAQLQEHTKLCKEQVDALLEDRRVRIHEFDIAHKRDEDKIQSLTEQLSKTQALLYDSTKDYLQLKYSHRAKERNWMAEKDQLLNDLDKMKEQVSSTAGQDSLLDFICFEQVMVSGDTKQAAMVNTQQLQIQLQQTQQLSDWYREQCIKQEDEIAKLKEEVDMSKAIFKERTEKITKRLELVNQRYEALEKRRNMEVQGYKADIKIQREKLKDLEKRLCKLTTSLSAGGGDLEVLAHVHQTAINSKKLMNELQQMKSQMYSLENKYRHIHD